MKMDIKMKLFFTALLFTLIPFYALGQNARKYYKAGTELVDNKKYEDAVVQFTSAIGLEPSNPDFYIARAKVYVKLLKYAEAKLDAILDGIDCSIEHDY